MRDDASTFLPETLALMPREFDLHEVPCIDLGAVRQALAARITVLLDRNPALLMSILYRIDVAEARVQHAIAHSPPDALASDLADLVLERQLQKVKLRRRYSSDADSSPT